MYFGDSEEDDHEEDEESQLFYKSPRDKFELNYSTDTSTKRPFGKLAKLKQNLVYKTYLIFLF